MKKFVLLLCLAAALATAGLWAYSLLTVGVDSEIVRVLEALDCPDRTSCIDGERFGDFAVVSASSLTRAEAGEWDGYAVEVYRGASGDRLALMRKGDRVYCAQYVNEGDAADYAGGRRFDNGVYAHESRNQPWAGMYFRIETAYFADGAYVQLAWRSPAEGKPDAVHRGTDGTILSLLRAEGGMRLSDYGAIEVGKSTYADIVAVDPLAADRAICTSYGYVVTLETADGRISFKCVHENGAFVVDEILISRD